MQSRDIKGPTELVQMPRFRAHPDGRHREQDKKLPGLALTISPKLLDVESLPSHRAAKKIGLCPLSFHQFQVLEIMKSQFQMLKSS
mmetsp:Transcript_6592/g.11350  ORF Transcript_6592/g.11350 Transcript_6592/m.11350 type:complete len:86 (-) Transcript_6592:282-539(-)